MAQKNRYVSVPVSTSVASWCLVVVVCTLCRPNTCAASFLFETPAGNFTTASFADEDAAKITEY